MAGAWIANQVVDIPAALRPVVIDACRIWTAVGEPLRLRCDAASLPHEAIRARLELYVMVALHKAAPAATYLYLSPERDALVQAVLLRLCQDRWFAAQRCACGRPAVPGAWECTRCIETAYRASGETAA